jgi:hypothetical protein
LPSYITFQIFIFAVSQVWEQQKAHSDRNELDDVLLASM